MDISASLHPLTSLPRLYHDDGVGQVLQHTKGSHDGVLLYHRKNNTFEGVAYAYHMLFRQRPNNQAKITSILVTPPHITEQSEVTEVLQQMLSLRLYTLPVFDHKRHLIGIVTAKSLLARMLDNQPTATLVHEGIAISEPLLVAENAAIKDVYTFMRKGHFSRAVIHSREDRLVGILTRRDIYAALLEPSPGNRFRKQGGTHPAAFFDRDWITQLDYPVKTFMSRPVVHVDSTLPRAAMVSTLLDSPHNAIVVTDQQERPVGVISLRNVLTTLLEIQPKPTIQQTVSDKNNILSAFRRQEMESLVAQIAAKIATRWPIQRIELVVEPIGKTSRTVKLYATKLEATNTNGHQIRATASHHHLRDAVRSCEDKLLRQTR